MQVGARVGGKEREGKKEDMEVLQIKYGTEGKMEQEELRADRR